MDIYVKVLKVLIISIIGLMVGKGSPLIVAICLFAILGCLTFLIFMLFEKKQKQPKYNSEAKPAIRGSSSPSKKADEVVPKCITSTKKQADGWYAGVNYEEDYKECLKRLSKEGQDQRRIFGLMISGDVDSYTLISSGGPYKEYFKKEISSKRSAKDRGKSNAPDVKDIPVLDNETIERWCKTEDTEKGERFIWTINSYGNGDCYKLKIEEPFENNLCKFLKPDSERIKKYGLNKVIHVDSTRHDLVHDPWHPVYPDLRGVTLRDLQVSGREHKHKEELFHEVRLRELSDAFFGNDSDKSVELIDGNNNKDEQQKAFCSMLDFGRRWADEHLKSVWEEAPVFCKTGDFSRCYQWEVPCYDGGCCDTDIAFDELSFERCEEDPGKWEALVEKIAHSRRYKNKEKENVLKWWVVQWGFIGDNVDLSTPIIASDNYETRELFLLNPFGMKGIYYFYRAYRPR